MCQALRSITGLGLKEVRPTKKEGLDVGKMSYSLENEHVS